MKLKLSEDEVSQTIDIKKTLGDVSGVDSVTEAFAQALIDNMVDRTHAGRDVHGKLFPKYSKAYTESLAFKVFGKKAGQVNMTLTGDMLASIQPEINGKDLKISVTGDFNNIKAFSHQTGYGGKAKREFFGITDSELDKIKKNFLPDLTKDSKKADESILSQLKKLLG